MDYTQRYKSINGDYLYPTLGPTVYDELHGCFDKRLVLNILEEGEDETQETPRAVDYNTGDVLCDTRHVTHREAFATGFQLDCGGGVTVRGRLPKVLIAHEVVDEENNRLEYEINLKELALAILRVTGPIAPVFRDDTIIEKGFLVDE